MAGINPAAKSLSFIEVIVLLAQSVRYFIGNVIARYFGIYFSHFSHQWDQLVSWLARWLAQYRVLEYCYCYRTQSTMQSRTQMTKTKQKRKKYTLSIYGENLVCMNSILFVFESLGICISLQLAYLTNDIQCSSSRSKL